MPQSTLVDVLKAKMHKTQEELVAALKRIEELEHALREEQKKRGEVGLPYNCRRVEG